jgi:transcriptional regulator CtsR
MKSSVPLINDALEAFIENIEAKSQEQEDFDIYDYFQVMLSPIAHYLQSLLTDDCFVYIETDNGHSGTIRIWYIFKSHS